MTGSKQDGVIKVWRTRDIEADVTSHSALTIKVPERQINQITALENANFIAVAESQGCIDIFSIQKAAADYDDLHDVSGDPSKPIKAI